MQPVPSSVPIDFSATLEAPTAQDPQQLAAECQQLWENYIGTQLYDVYRDSKEAQLTVVALQVGLADGGRGSGRRRARTLRLGQLNRPHESYIGYHHMWHRWLGEAPQQSIDLQALGTAGFILNGTSTILTTPQEFQQAAQDIMNDIVTQESLQQALVSGGNTDATVKSVTNNAYQSTESPGNLSPVRIAFGFILLVLTILSLVLWIRFLHNKRQEARKKKRMEELRKSQMKMMGVSGTKGRGDPASLARASPGSAASYTYPVINELPTKDDDSSENSSNYPGLESYSEDRAADNDSDAFGKELRQAASQDQMAWMELLQQKEQMERASQELVWTVSETGTQVPKNAIAVSSPRGKRDRSVISVYSISGRSHEEGFEMRRPASIDRKSSFPYGDENDSDMQRDFSKHHDDLELTLRDAVEWTATGVALRVIPQEAAPMEDDAFEPYGDSHQTNNSLFRSWNIRSPIRRQQPVEKQQRPSRYSFAYPLRQQQLSDSSQSSQESNVDCFESERRNIGVAANGRGRGIDDLVNRHSSGSDSEGATDPDVMMEEVERLSSYVKLYGQKKKREKSFRDELEMNYNYDDSGPNPLLERLESSRNSPRRNMESPLHRDIFESMDPASDSYKTTASKTKMALGLQPTMFPTGGQVGLGSTSGDMEASDDENTGRLGIGRFTVQKPPHHLLSILTSDAGPERAEPRSSIPYIFETGQMESRRTLTIPHKPDPGESIPNRTHGKSSHPASTASNAENWQTDEPLRSVASFPMKPAPTAETRRMTPSSTPAAVQDRAASSPRRVPTRTDASTAPPEDDTNSALTMDTLDRLALAAGRSAAAAPPTAGAPPAAAATPTWRRPAPQASPRSGNSRFNHIVDMFESKPKTAIQPLSENWQHNGATTN